MGRPKSKQVRRGVSHLKSQHDGSDGGFNYSLNYSELDLRLQPHLYRVGIGEQGVLLVEPYKSEILPFWRFKTPAIAQLSATAIYSRFKYYRKKGDFIGMDMARKFLQMGYTRSRRYANHRSGKKYSEQGDVLPFAFDMSKAEAAEFFLKKWREAESDQIYIYLKSIWKKELG